MNDDKYVDNILLKLKREYSKDEIMGIFVKKIKDLEFENGVLKSEVEENIYLNKVVSTQLENAIKKLEKIKPESEIIALQAEKIANLEKLYADKLAHFERSKKEMSNKIKSLEKDLEYYRALRRESIRKEKQILGS